MAQSSQENFDFVLILEAGMVGTDRDLHGRRVRALLGPAFMRIGRAKSGCQGNAEGNCS
jgi:hypothetical protein